MTISHNLLPWQQHEWNLLQNYCIQQRVPQALLVTGAIGVGKYELALRFAYSLLCTNIKESGINCGECRACQLIKSNTHPDLIEINPEEEKKNISINQIRKLVMDTNLKPQYEAYRAVIIHPADVMTVSAINGFLKCLEEPNERTVFILLTAKPNKLPATVISRCQKLSIKLPSNKALLDWLKEQGINNNLDTLSNLIKTSTLNLQQVVDDNILKQRTDFFIDWLAIAKSKSYPTIVAEKWQSISGQLLLSWVISWLSDLVKCGHSIKAEQLSNQDMIKSLQELSQHIDKKRLYIFYDQILKNRQQIDTQVNYQIMLEESLVQWQKLNCR